MDFTAKKTTLRAEKHGICRQLFAELSNHTDNDNPRETTYTGIEAETDHDDVIISENDRQGPEQDATLWDENDTIQPVNILSSYPLASGKPIIIKHPAFSDLRSASIATSTKHTYVKGYNALIADVATLDLQAPSVLDKQLKAYMQMSHRGSARPATLSKVRNGTYCLLLMQSHLNNQIVATKKLLLKWKNSTIHKSAIPLLQPFEHAFAFHSIRSGRKYPELAILCSQAAYIRSIELRRLRWADVGFPGDVRLAHEPGGSAAFVVHSPKNDKGKSQIRVFNDIFVIAMLQIFRDDHVRQLGEQDVNSAADILQQPICQDLSYHAYKDAIKTVVVFFGLLNSRFATHGARIGAEIAQFA